MMRRKLTRLYNRAWRWWYRDEQPECFGKAIPDDVWGAIPTCEFCDNRCAWSEHSR